jgi:transposase
MMQKTLVQMNVHLQLVVADVAGETDMRILRAIVKGCRDPRKLAAFRNYRCRRSEAEIAKALDGVWDDAHLFELKQLLQAWDFQRRQLAACDRRFEKECGALPDRSAETPMPPPTRSSARKRNEPALDVRGLVFRMTGVDLCAIDGLGANTALAVLAETGPDVSRFPTDKHFASWTGLAPRRDQSGKRKRTPSPPASGATRVAQAFRLAAYSLMRSQTVLGCFLRRMKARLGPGPAIRATACKLAKLFWRLLTKRERYRPEDVAAYVAGFQERRKRWLARQAAALGLALTTASAPTT